MTHIKIKETMIKGVAAFSMLHPFIKNDDLRDLVVNVQNNIKRKLKRGNYNRSI